MTKKTHFHRLAGFLLIAVWFGLIGGLLEGTAHWIFETTGLLGWSAHRRPVDHGIIWATTGLNTVLFAAITMGIAPFFLVFRKIPAEKVLHRLFAALAAFGILMTTGRLAATGTAMLAIGLGAVCGAWMDKRETSGRPLVRRTMPWVAAAAMTVCAAVVFASWAVERIGVAQLPAPPASPNVLLVVLDTLRADRLGVYGYPRNTSAFLDDLAKNSVVFDKAFANASWTLPSHASLFTGRLPTEHGATLKPYDGRFPTIAEVLGSRGYATVGIVANNSVLTRSSGLARGFQHWENAFINLEDDADHTVYGGRLRRWFRRYVRSDRPTMQFDAEGVNRRFLQWLDGRPKRPFFAFLNYMDVHYPYQPPNEYLERFVNDRAISNAAGKPSTSKRPSEQDAIRYLNDSYDAAVAYLDAQLRVLFEELRRRGLTENTLVIISADHGESLGEHNLLEHRPGLYLNQIRIPLIVHMPSRIAGGRRIIQPASLHQVTRTIAELAGVPADSFAAASLDFSEAGASDDAAILSHASGGDWPGVQKHWPIAQGWVISAINSRWHLIAQQNGQEELYDWVADPKETQNLARRQEHQATLLQMKRELQKHWALPANSVKGVKGNTQ